MSATCFSFDRLNLYTEHFESTGNFSYIYVYRKVIHGEGKNVILFASLKERVIQRLILEKSLSICPIQSENSMVYND